MSHQRTYVLAAAIAIAMLIVGLGAIPAQAAPSAAQIEADRERVEAAVAELDDAQDRAAEVEAQVAQASAELDRLLAEQTQARKRLSLRASMMYRTGETSFLEVLLGAESFQDFAATWHLLMRMNEQEAQDLETLANAKADAEEAAAELMALQAEQAQALEAAEASVARARTDLAQSETALKEYEARIAAQAAARSEAAAPASTPSDNTDQQASGSGSWQSAAASHYSWTFTGRGASGKSIGPYSMMVAHRTLPFGTLVEFEYKGKRAVASVEDRGPHVPGRTWDLGPGVARALNFTGVHDVRYRVID